MFVTFVSFLSFSVYYSLKWRYSRGGGLETLNPFLVAQLTTTGNQQSSLIDTQTTKIYEYVFEGNYQTTEYTEDGIIIPKLFYKKKKETNKKKEENKDQVDSSTMELQVKGEDEVCSKEKDVLVLDVELLEELSLQMEDILQDSTKIISEVLLPPPPPPPPQPRTRPGVPALVEVEAMERPLEASYQASVPVVQVQQ